MDVNRKKWGRPRTQPIKENEPYNLVGWGVPLRSQSRGFVCSVREYFDLEEINTHDGIIVRDVLLKMPVTADDIKTLLRDKLDAVHVDVTDDSDGCGGKFTVLIVSDKFIGKQLLQRHRLVNEALAEELKSIHAFSQKTMTKEEWEKSK